MKHHDLHRGVKDSTDEILIIIKKLGLPFVILGIIFILYSWQAKYPVIPFSYFMIVFLFLALIQTMFENLWLSKEIKKINSRLDKITRKSKS